MAEMKICNLDLIAPVQKRQLVLNGNAYEVEPLTVQKFIEFTQLQQSIKAETSITEGLAIMKKIIHAAIPSMSEDIMDRMTVSHLQLVVAFIRDEIPDEILNGKSPKNSKKKAEKEEEGDKAEDKSGI